MTLHFGILEIGRIENENSSAEFNLTSTHIKFVHYPDCQQLIIWLPRPGREYSKVQLIDVTTELVSKEWEVGELLNGSIQLLWDTFSWTPGEYKLEIRTVDGIIHIVHLVKHKENIITEKIAIATPTEDKKAVIQYRDGFGKIIQDEDLILREKLVNDLVSKFGRYLEYTGNLRAGSVIYHDGDLRIEFQHEMGGGNCMFYIEIPSEKDWEQRTNTSTKSRMDILEFVANAVQVEQASNCNFTIRNDTITFNYK